jgi:hypothetical protein
MRKQSNNTPAHHPDYFEKIDRIAMNLTNCLMSATGGEKTFIRFGPVPNWLRSAIANQLELECEELITG